MNDIEIAYEALRKKGAAYDLLWRYYDGDHPIVYNSEKLKAIFNNISARFTENWCAVVVDAALERINISGVSIADAGATSDALTELFRDTGLQADADLVHEDTLVVGESFVIVWYDDESDVDALPQAFWNDARMVHVEYDPANPRRKRFAAKWFDDEDGHRRLTLYYPDRLEYYRSRNKASDLQRASDFVPYDVDGTGLAFAENPFNMIPVFHFRSTRRRPRSAIANVIEPQDAVNKLLADMMVAAEFGAFKQRYVISNSDVSQLKNRPNEIWQLWPAQSGEEQPTTVGEFSETDLAIYLNAIDRIVTDIGIITRTPRHYFYRQAGDPSGEALIAMEAPLNKKCADYIAQFVHTWREILSFLWQMQTGTAIPSSQIEIMYEEPATVQPRTRAEIRQIDRQSGIALETVLRWQGYTQAEIDEVLAEQVRERQMATTAANQVLEIEQRISNRINGDSAA